MSMGNAPRVWGGSTLDERSAERRQKLVEAAFDLLATEGGAAVTVRAVTRAAALSPRYFYESFDSREDLLVAAFDAGFDRIKVAVEKAMAEAPENAQAQARASVDATAACLEDDPRLGRALLRETLADPTLRTRAEAALPEYILGVALRTFGEAIATDPAKFQVGVLAVSGMEVALLMAWSEGLLVMPREELVERILDVITAVVSVVN